MMTIPDAKGAPFESWEPLQWQLIRAMASCAPM